MRYPHAKPLPLNEPEVVLNLWAYADEDGMIIRLAGKAYVMQGSDQEKLALLRQLSPTDFLSVAWAKVPSNFKVIHANGEEMEGFNGRNTLPTAAFTQELLC